MRRAAAAAVVSVATLALAGCGGATESATVAAGSGQLPGAARLQRGGVVHLAAGRYGRLDLSGLHPRTPLTLQGAGRRQVALGAVDLDGATDVRLSGVTITGGVQIGGGARRIELRDSELRDRGIAIRRARDVRITRVYVHDVALRKDGPPGDGMGLWVQGSTRRRPADRAQGITVQGACFSHLAEDGAHLGDVDGVRIAGSEFRTIFPSVDPSVHADAIQVHEHARDVVVTDSWFHQTNRGIIVKDDVYPGFRFERNVFEHLRDWALDLYDTPGVRVVGNLARHHPGASVLLHEQHGQMRGAVLRDNALERMTFTRSEIADEGGQTVAHPAADTHYAADDRLGVEVPGTAAPARMRACDRFR